MSPGSPCRYCGTEMLVHRKGGTVSLNLVAEAIRNVQIGTGKTATGLRRRPLLPRRRRFIQDQPVESELGDRNGELVEVDRFAYIAVAAEIVARGNIALFS